MDEGGHQGVLSRRTTICGFDKEGQHSALEVVHCAFSHHPATVWLHLSTSKITRLFKSAFGSFFFKLLTFVVMCLIPNHESFCYFYIILININKIQVERHRFYVHKLNLQASPRHTVFISCSYIPLIPRCFDLFIAHIYLN